MRRRLRPGPEAYGRRVAAASSASCVSSRLCCPDVFTSSIRPVVRVCVTMFKTLKARIVPSFELYLLHVGRHCHSLCVVRVDFRGNELEIANRSLGMSHGGLVVCFFSFSNLSTGVGPDHEGLVSAYGSP